MIGVKKRRKKDVYLRRIVKGRNKGMHQRKNECGKEKMNEVNIEGGREEGKEQTKERKEGKR